MAKSKRITRRNATVQSVTDFNPDYSDVRKDLKRIGILAGTFISILIIISFILR